MLVARDCFEPGPAFHSGPNWMDRFRLAQVQEEDADAELGSEFPRRHRRSSPSAQKKKGRHGVTKSPLQKVSERSMLEVPTLVGVAKEKESLHQQPLATAQVMTGAQLSGDARDVQRCTGMPDGHAPAVHVATAKAWYRSSSRYSLWIERTNVKSRHVAGWTFWPVSALQPPALFHCNFSLSMYSTQHKTLDSGHVF